MKEQVRTALLLFVWLSVITGVLYPLAVTGVAKLVFPQQAEGSIITIDGVAVGSELIGQQFSSPAYFWSRLSATGPFPYNSAVSSGSNYAPLNPALHDAVRGRVEELGGGVPPVDLVTASGSGLDPHISPAAAEFQLQRVAAARGIAEEDLRQLVRQHTDGRLLGLIGEPTVKVLTLNLALDELTGKQQ
jgi:K+-transporting ATPase ATPase C chain